MAALAYLDTHVLVWLYAGGRAGVPEPVAAYLESTEGLRVSPMVRLEMQYLHEIGRLKVAPVTVLDALQSVLPLSVCGAPFAAVVRAAEAEAWTRDPFDRLIVAQAALLEAPLVTRDAVIHAHYPRAWWGAEVR
jgi:PIN domain nuclease of toxin-antitoxin system